MKRKSLAHRGTTLALALLAAPSLLILAGCGAASVPQTATQQPSLTQISSDPYTIGPMQHATEVEPHMVAYGSTLVAAFQVGRVGKTNGWAGGATDTGWSTSTDGGVTWTHGFLPGLTQSQGLGAGPYNSASDPVVTYDAKHAVWMIASLPVSNAAVPEIPAVIVNRSTDGGFTWQAPVNVGPMGNSDKNWFSCDNTPTSPYFGNCYMEWGNENQNGQIQMSTSSDGGLTWGPPIPTEAMSYGIGGEPLAQPNGTVVVPFIGTNNVLSAYISSNGGASWLVPVIISPIQLHSVLGGLRAAPLPSAAVDGAGNVWVVWQDCRFRPQCSSNDLVYSTSSDGIHWSSVTRVPIDLVTTTVDHFIPGVGIDPTTSGSSAHVAIHYYYYSQSNCSTATCELSVGYIASANGGTTWNAPVTLAGPMQLGWLPISNNGLMVGDYIATAFTNGVPHGVFAVAEQTNGTQFNQAIYTAQGMTAAAQGPQFSSAGDKPLHHLSDPFDVEHLEPHARKSKRNAR
jgi:hypothetical protein